MTRPRIAGSVDSCIRLFVELVKVRVDTPMTTSAAPNSQAFGVIAANAKPAPKIAAPIEQKLEARLLAPRGEQRAGKRADRHDRRQQPVLAGAAMKDA